MRVKVVGKSGYVKFDKRIRQDMENTIIHVKYRRDDVTGEAARTAWVGWRICLPDDVLIGRTYEMEEAGGYVVKFALIEEDEHNYTANS